MFVCLQVHVNVKATGRPLMSSSETKGFIDLEPTSYDRLAGQWAPGILSLPPWHSLKAHASIFPWVLGTELGPSCYAARTLAPEPFPWSCNVLT